jgi:hypothetical protein
MRSEQGRIKNAATTAQPDTALFTRWQFRKMSQTSVGQRGEEKVQKSSHPLLQYIRAAFIVRPLVKNFTS